MVAIKLLSTATAIGRYRHTEAADGTSRKFSGMKSLKRTRWYAAVVLSVAATMLICEDRGRYTSSPAAAAATPGGTQPATLKPRPIPEAGPLVLPKSDQ